MAVHRKLGPGLREDTYQRRLFSATLTWLRQALRSIRDKNPWLLLAKLQRHGL